MVIFKGGTQDMFECLHTGLNHLPYLCVGVCFYHMLMEAGTVVWMTGAISRKSISFPEENWCNSLDCTWQIMS